MNNKKTIINKICEKWSSLCPSDIKIPSEFLADFKRFLIMKKIPRTNLAYICKLYAPKFIKYIIRLAKSSSIMNNAEYKFIFRKYNGSITGYEKKKKEEKILGVKISDTKTDMRISKFEDLINIRQALKIEPSTVSTISPGPSKEEMPMNFKLDKYDPDDSDSDSADESGDNLETNMSTSVLSMKKSELGITGTLENINNAEKFADLWNENGYPEIDSAYIINNHFPPELIKKWMTITDKTVSEMDGVWSFIEKKNITFSYIFGSDSDGFILLSEYEDEDIELDIELDSVLDELP